MRKLAILAVITCLFFITSCQYDVKNELPDKLLMERLLKEKPDSLALLLEDRDPLLMSDEDKADYAVWLIQAHSKQRRSLINDTLIHFAVDYYKNIDSPKLLNAYFLAAEQSNWASIDPAEQIQILEEALHVAVEKRDTYIIQQVCVRLMHLYDTSKEKEKLEDLIPVIKKHERMKDDPVANLNLMRVFSLLSQSDSIIKYAPNAIKVAQEKNASDEEFYIKKEYVEALNSVGQNRKALEVLRGIKRNANELKFNYIGTWIAMGEVDSARMYIDSLQTLVDKYRYKAPEETNIIELCLLIMKTVINTKEGKNYSNRDLGILPDKVMKYTKQMMRNDRERQFMESKLIEHNYTLAIEKARLHQVFLWSGIVALVIIGLIITIYQRKLLKKERSMQKTKEQLRLHTIQLSENASIIDKNEELIKTLYSQIDDNEDVRQEIDILTKENNTLKEKNEILHSDIKKYSHSTEQDQDLDAYEKLAEQNNKLQERERYLTVQLIRHTEELNKLSRSPRYIDDMQWPEVIHAVNQLFDGFSYRLHADFPLLTEEDIRYCCLLKLRLSTSIIAILTGISPSSVTKRKQRIKDKMNQQRPEEIKKEQPIEINIWNY